MDKTICNVKINSSDFIISISGLHSVDIKLDYKADIDFTEIVRHLTSKIDNNNFVEFYCDENLTEKSEKENLLIETLKCIFESFNESAISFDLKNEENSELSESDLPF